MKFSIKKEILLEALNKVSKAISTKNVIIQLFEKGKRLQEST